ncbi:MAG: SDR family oxidoreductase [Gemmatimonadota bacterium]
MRVAVTGASGLLGSMVVHKAFPRDGTGSPFAQPVSLLALTRSRALKAPGTPAGGPGGAPASADTDEPELRVQTAELTQEDSWRRPLEDFRPHALIHCAALTHVDRCEEDPQEARRQNALVPQALARWCAREGVRLVHISTDGVFSGPIPPGGFPEGHSPSPVNVYGATKAEGEQRVLEVFPEALVVRTNLFGWGLDGPAALAGWILRTLEGDAPVPGWTDVRFNPLFTGTLAAELLKLAVQPPPGPTGLLHVAAGDAMSKHDFARAVAVEWGYSPERVKATRSTDASLKARRSLDTTLAVTRWEALRGAGAPFVEEEVAAMHRFGTEEAHGLEVLGARHEP